MQTNRLFEIIYILLNKRLVTAKELAEHFEVSTRTIYRDVETLSGAGIPIYMSKGKGGGIALLPEFVLNKTVITEQEKEDILSSLSALGAVSFQDQKATLEKMSRLLGTSDTNWIEVHFGLWSDGEKEGDFFQIIKQAILQKQVVQFTYINAKGERLVREVEPLKLIFKGTAWYVYGYCRRRENVRFFKLKRIRNLEVMQEYFVRTIPEKILLSYNEQEIKKAELVRVKLKIEKEASYRALDDFENCQMQEDGSVLVEMDLPNGKWLISHILSYGKACTILEPKELCEEITETLSNMLEKYK